jgi:hypothetical protein
MNADGSREVPQGFAYVAPIHGALRLIQERGCVIVSDVDRYAIIGKSVDCISEVLPVLTHQ